MINKILITLILLSLILTIGNGEIVKSGTLELEIDDSYNIDMQDSDYQLVYSNTWLQSLYYKSEALTGDIDILYFTNVKIQKEAVHAWEDVPISVGGSFELFVAAVSKGTGNCYIRKTATTNVVDIYYYFDSNCVWIDDTTYDITVTSTIMNYWFHSYFMASDSYDLGQFIDNIHCNINPNPATYTPNGCWGEIDGTPGNAYNEYHITFKNDYSINQKESGIESTITRIAGESGKSSAYILRDINDNLIYSSGYVSTDTIYNHDDGIYYYYLEPEASGIEYLIYSWDYTTDATLTTVEDTYEIGDNVQYSYINLDKLDSETIIYNLVSYYYDAYGIITFDYIIPLTNTLNENTDIAYMSTSGLKPNKMYYAVIDSTIDYYLQNTFDNNKELEGYYNLTYGYEFIQNQCNGSYCDYNNGDTVIFNYWMNGTYDAYIHDHDGTILREILNLTGFGYVSYDIPKDNDKDYSYPNWYITLNQSSDNFTVYWLEIEPDEIGLYQPDDIDDEIQAGIDEMKTGLTPFKDLIFGISTIFIDNPDYNSDGIIEVNEIDGFLNSIIPWILVLLIFIMYKGLTMRK